MTSSDRTAQEICTNLGTTLEEVEYNAERVREYVDTLENQQAVTTSETYGNRMVHLHQLVSDPSYNGFVVIKLEPTFVQVADVDTWQRATFAKEELVGGLITVHIADDGSPIFAY